LVTQKLEISEDMYDKAIVLNGFSVQIRYPHNTVYLTTEELELSIAISEVFRAFAINTIGITE
jgi:hypothetical protein